MVRLLMVVAVICFVIALLGQLSVFNGVDVTAWALGGLLAWSTDVLLVGFAIGGVGVRRHPPA
jgi:hypothetical protein